MKKKKHPADHLTSGQGLERDRGERRLESLEVQAVSKLLARYNLQKWDILKERKRSTGRGVLTMDGFLQVYTFPVFLSYFYRSHLPKVCSISNMVLAFQSTPFFEAFSQAEEANDGQWDNTALIFKWPRAGYMALSDVGCIQDRRKGLTIVYRVSSDRDLFMEPLNRLLDIVDWSP